MSNPNDQLNDEQSESLFDQSENEPEPKAKTGFTAHGITGGKIPHMVGDAESE